MFTDVHGRDRITGLVSALRRRRFVGSALCRRLVSAGHQVMGYDNLPRGRRNYYSEGVRLIERNVRSPVRPKATVAASKPDWETHVAAMHHIRGCIARPQETMELNVDDAAPSNCWT